MARRARPSGGSGPSQDPARQGACGIDDVLALLPDRGAVDDDGVDSLGVGDQAIRTLREVVDPPERAAAHGLGVEDRDVGSKPFRETSAERDVRSRTACSIERTPFSRTQRASRSVGAHASHSWLAWAPASDRPSIDAG